MAIKLNLLPQEYAVPSGLNKILKSARALGIIFLAAFVIFAIGLSAFFFISSLQLRRMTAETEVLKSKIVSQQETEQKIVLLKDRINKIKIVKAMPSALTNLGKLNLILANLSPDSSLSELSIDSKKTEVSVLFRNSVSFANFLKTLKESDDFSQVTLKSFGFNPVNGYLVTVQL